MIMEKMMNTKAERNTFTKKIGQTVYIVRYYFSEEAKETMQEKINRMLVQRFQNNCLIHLPANPIAQLKKPRRSPLRLRFFS